MRILIIEDNQDLAAQFVEALAEQQYLVDTTHDGLIGWEMMQSVEYDLVILDVMLPGLDGLSLCRRLRDQGQLVPVLMLTARGESRDQITGLDSGADDYLVKPVRLAELNARVRALLRRGKVHPTSSVLEIGNLLFDPCAAEVTYGGQPLALRPKEFALLELFLRHPNRLFSRSAILDQLWSFDDEPPEENTIKSHIKGLRQKLKSVGMEDLVETVYGLGYRLNAAYLNGPEPAGKSSPTATSMIGELQNRPILLIVEGHRSTSEQLAEKARHQGWRPKVVATLAAARESLKFLAPGALMLGATAIAPEEDRLELVFELAKHYPQTAVLMHQVCVKTGAIHVLNCHVIATIPAAPQEDRSSIS